MDKILIHGGHPLSGSIKVSGSKNSSLPILAATLLTREPCVVHRVPDLSDTHYMLQILIHLGTQVERASGTVSVTAEKIQSVAPYDVVRKMRASVCVLGPLLGRCKEATVSMPGGCVIGDRPIDLHLKGFEALGAAVRVEGGNIKVFAPKLRGAVINLRGKFGPTVLGTDNVMMAAVLAEGTTVIEGAAQEPEVVDLANFLNKMGAKIEGAGTRRLIIEGVKELHGVEHDIIPDRIEAGMMSCSTPCNSFTPSMIKRRVPAPSILAPILFRKFARSTTSGSWAAPSITVVPSASTAAIMTLSVPRTVGPNFPRKLITAPRNFGAKTFILPPSTRTAAPSASKPFSCKSIGRSPMTHPPGIDTVASLQRPSSGPSTQTEARILRTTS